MKRVPIGIQDFKKIRERGLYFVDKSALIDSVLSGGYEAFLVTRPRRFGKSLNLSMLDAYLNMRYAGNRWFDGLKIRSMRPDDREMNAYPVIRLDMKEFNVRSYEIFMSSARFQMSAVYGQFMELADSEAISDDRRELFDDILHRRTDEGTLAKSLRLLSEMLYAHYGRKTIILVDEYDNPINNAYGKPFQRGILEFTRDFLSSALKGNDSMMTAVITGVMQIAKESIFSGLNNLKVDNILSRDMDEMFGFTPSEVEGLCSDFGHPEKFAEAREWYDGYRFGSADVYNPWSVMNYVDSGFVPDRYWGGTSGNSIIYDLLSVADEETYSNLLVLGSGGAIRSNLNAEVTFADISDRSAGIYNVMALTGYLTAQKVSDRVWLSIPNREMFGVFADTIISRMGAGSLDVRLRSFSKAVLSGDADGMSSSLEDFLMSTLSSRVLDNEHSYQAFIVGLLMNLFGNYTITADFESGSGYHDIRMVRNTGNGPNVVMEIKRVGPGGSDGTSAEQLAHLALKQIHDKGYCHGMTGRTILYGVAFDSKTPVVESEELILR